MDKALFTPFPVLTTQRLTLRALVEADLDALHALRSDPFNRRFLAGEVEQTPEETQAFMYRVWQGIADDKWVLWAISQHDDPGLLGTICLWQFNPDRTVAEVGYELLPAAQGQGYMSEALERVVSYGVHDLRLHQIEAFTNRDNLASRKLLERCGFALLREASFEDIHGVVYGYPGVRSIDPDEEDYSNSP
ncbi:MAG: GNAT family N-acetyltransferase [Saprospiraceae bacterium]|nr:GNAT family N-acetyltransferase [Saprospiraceae bacterium]